jgi:hypothetical protein
MRLVAIGSVIGLVLGIGAGQALRGGNSVSRKPTPSRWLSARRLFMASG